MSTTLATVVAVIGEVQVRNANGELRKLHPGDVIQIGDSIVTSPNGRVELKFEDGGRLEIDPNQTVAMTEELAATTRPQSQEAEVGTATLARVLDAVEPVKNPDSDNAPASGQGGEADDGNSFVRLLRVQEQLEQLKFEFGASRSNALNPYDGGVLDETSDINSGYSFVRLPRIQERIEPIDFTFGTFRPDILNPFNGGSGTRILNQSPSAIADSTVVTEDIPLIVPASAGLLVNDSDPDGGLLTVTGFSITGIAGSFNAGQTATIPGIGTLLIQTDGGYTFTPAPDFNGPVPVVTYTISDGQGDTSTSTLRITVNPVVDIADDAVTTNEDTPVTTSVLVNDSFEGTPLITAITQGTHGTVVNNGDGTLTYTPDPDYNGTDSYTYTVTSPTGVTETATVNVTVNPVVDIADDTVTTNEDTPVTTSVLVNDSFQGTPLITAITQGTHGTVVNNGDGTLTYTPDPDYNGPDSYTYTVTSPTGVTETATVNVTVNPVNDTPVAQPDTNAVNEDATLTVNAATGVIQSTGIPAGLDSDIDGDALTVIGVSTGTAANTAAVGTANVGGSLLGTYGHLTLNGDGSYSYVADTAAADALGTGVTATDTFSYAISDGEGGTAFTTLTITLTGTNDTPVAIADTASVTEDAADQAGNDDSNAATTIVAGNVLTNDTDVDTGDTRSVTGVAAGTPGSASGSVATGVTGTYGSVNIAANGAYTYSLDNTDAAVQALAVGETLTDTFTYTITDSQGATSSTTLTVTVNGSNDAPVISIGAGDSAAESLIETNAGLSVSGTLSIGDVDTSDTVTMSKVDTITKGGTYAGVLPTDAALKAMFSVTGGESSTAQDSLANGIIWTFDSGAQAFDAIPDGQTLILTYTVRATDTQGATDDQTVQITITGTNDSGVINSDTASSNEDAVLAGNLLSNDTTDPDSGESLAVSAFTVDMDGDGDQDNFVAGDTATLTTASGGNIGTFQLAADGGYTFTPHTHYSGPVPVVTYTGGNASFTGSASLSITLNPVSDAPALSRDAATVSTDEDTAVTLGLNAPSVTDATDENLALAGDNPERLSLITLTGIPSGVQLLDGSGGDALLTTSTGAAITVLLSDATNLVATPGAATLTLTTAQFEALKVNPVAHNATNFTVTMSVTEFEVDDANVPISGVAGATSTTTVAVDVRAVTDAVDLKINGGDADYDATINEDTSFDLGALLSATFSDLDGSETRFIDLAGLPTGSVVNGVTVGVGGTASVQLVGNNTLPAISLTPPPDFSGDIGGITVTLRALDSDADSPPPAPAELTDFVTLNLHVNPIADDISAPNVTTPEDTPVKFMASLAVSDTGTGVETLTGISVMNLPTGWVIKNHLGAIVHNGDGATDYTLPGADVTSLSLDYKNYTLTPPAHSSTDISLTLSITSSDSNTVNGAAVVSTITADHVIDVTVTPVAELIGGDSDGNALDDLTMNGDFTYTTHGLEDTWFRLDTDGFVFETPWSNEDADEQTFALLTPTLSGGSAIGSQFKYTDGGGAHELTYVGAPVEIPIAWLDTVEFKAAANIAGFFSIGIQAKTIDTDPDTGATVTATSGTATLTNLAIDPVADNVTLSVVSPATGNEDSALPLVIRPTSADLTETFDVTISGIPAGTVSLVYDGVAQTITAGSVTIVNFDKTRTLTITPPPDSNVDFTLTVDAVSVDAVAGMPTSTSVATTLPISVDILGVADAAVIATATPANTEAVVDAAGGQIALSSLITSAALGDSDGSEGLTLKLTGLDAQFDITGATFLFGAGSSRVWVLTPAELATANLVAPANFSGTVTLSLIPITTEDDGNSLSDAPIALSTTITPSPEATLNTSTTLNEDTLAQVSFALQAQNGDSNETLASVWITAADVDANPNFTLYFGNGTSTTLAAAAGSQPGVVLDAGMYKLTGAAINNLYVKGANNLSGSDSFGIQYEVTDPSSDASLAAVTTQTSATYTLTINPVTDAAAAAISGITASNANAGVAGTIVTATGTTSLDVTVAISKLNDVNAGNTPDTDTSESLIQLIIDGVPQGVNVVGATYIGNSTAGGNTGQWLLSVADTFNSATLSRTVTFDLDGTASQLGGLDQLISINAVTQDGAAATVAASASWTLQTAPVGTFDDTAAVPQVPANIDTWNVVPLPANVALEDTTLNANDLIDAQISGSGPFSITLTNVPAGATVTGMTAATVGGETIWTASATGGNAALQALLNGIGITPPANLNSNNAGNLAFNATLTTYAAGGARTDATFAVSQPITPVSDAAVVTVSAPNANEGDAVAFTVQVANPADAGFAGLVDGKLYLKLDSSGLNPATGGSLSDAGGALATTTVSGVAGVPDGDYYVINGVSVGDTLNFTYTPDAHASGAVSLTAYVQSQETNAGNVIAASGTDSFNIAPVNSGYNLAANNASGAEDSRIQLDITSAGLVDGDGSESVLGATLKNVPNGYLVYVGANAGAAILATNAGDDGLGNNIWAIPATGGVLPAYIAVLPPPNASGTVTGLQLSVLTREAGLAPTETNVSFDLIVAGVADGITLTPTLSFGVEGDIIPLNLNASMLDTDGSETATLTINGLGQYAAFFANAAPLAAAYDSGTDTYTLAGIDNADVNNLGFLQGARSGTLNISAFTSDGASTSVPVNATLSIDIGDKLATTGNDTLLYDGNPLNGLAGVDVVQLRLGENLDFATSPVKPSNIETLDLMPAGQVHSLSNLTLQDVLDMTDSGKTLSILGDGGDSVSLKDGAGVWSKGAAVSEGGHTFDVYSNSLDPAVTLKIEQAINASIV